MIEHVIWDWNGTLLDDVDACVGSINRMLPARGLPAVDSERYRRVFDFPVISYYVELGFDLDSERWDAVAVEFHEHYGELAKKSRLREGIREVLSRLHAAGVSMSVLSACENTILNRMLEEHGIAHFFGQVRGLDNLYASSKLETGRMHLRELNIPSGRIVLVGDTLHDVEVADALGIRCMLVGGGHQHEERLSAFALLNSPQELLSQLLPEEGWR